MKRLVSFLSVALVGLSMAFARGTYAGDVQFHVGLDLTEVKIESQNYELKKDSFAFDVATWHLFALNDVIRLGFTASLDGIAGNNQLAYDFNVGPAIGFDLGNVVRFGATIGLNVGGQVSSEGIDYVNVFSELLGATFGVQAKFIPQSKVSPLIGYRFVSSFANNYDVEGTHVTKYNVKENLNFYENVFYTGLSINF
ncbi:MAG: hypothetical protein J6X84_08030 [Treponema sp.]|nr:hypothetical protein [Treponema sp.]